MKSYTMKICSLCLLFVIITGCCTTKQNEQAASEEPLKANMEQKMTPTTEETNAEKTGVEENAEDVEVSDEFSEDVNWMLRYTLNHGFNPADNLEPNSNEEEGDSKDSSEGE